MDERALVARLRAGDRAAFDKVVALHAGAMLRVARAFVREPAVAEEIVQDAWLAMLEGLDRFEERASLRTWLLAILTNRARTRAARERRSLPFSALARAEEADDHDAGQAALDQEGAWQGSPARWSDEDPERLALSAETLAVVAAEIAALPQTQRTVITLCDVEGLDAVEVCELLEISSSNQRVLLHRARTKVRRALEKHLGGGVAAGER